MHRGLKEEVFKAWLEQLIRDYDQFDNLFSFIESKFPDYTDQLDVIQDFAEELINYEKDVEELFQKDLYNIDPETLNIQFVKREFENIRNALAYICSVSANDFERLCALVLKYIGCSRVHSTKRTHDQGIDFVGIIRDEKERKLLYRGNAVSKIFVIGQAKHYEYGKVEAKEVRELAGSIYLLRSRSFAVVDEPYKGITSEIKAYTPIFAYFITSNFFTQSAKQLCKNADIMFVDRILLAMIFGLAEDYQQEGCFSTKELEKAIRSVAQIQ